MHDRRPRQHTVEIEQASPHLSRQPQRTGPRVTDSAAHPRRPAPPRPIRRCRAADAGRRSRRGSPSRTATRSPTVGTTASRTRDRRAADQPPRKLSGSNRLVLDGIGLHRSSCRRAVRIDHLPVKTAVTLLDDLEVCNSSGLVVTLTQVAHLSSPLSFGHGTRDLDLRSERSGAWRSSNEPPAFTPCPRDPEPMSEGTGRLGRRGASRASPTRSVLRPSAVASSV